MFRDLILAIKAKSLQPFSTPAIDFMPARPFVCPERCRKCLQVTRIVELAYVLVGIESIATFPDAKAPTAECVQNHEFAVNFLDHFVTHFSKESCMQLFKEAYALFEVCSTELSPCPLCCEVDLLRLMVLSYCKKVRVRFRNELSEMN